MVWAAEDLGSERRRAAHALHQVLGRGGAHGGIRADRIAVLGHGRDRGPRETEVLQLAAETCHGRLVFAERKLDPVEPGLA